MLDANNIIIVIGIIVLLYILRLYFRCKKLEKQLHDACIVISAQKTVLFNKVVNLANDTRDIHIINKDLDMEIAACCNFILEHEEELINRVGEDGIVNVDNKEDK